MVIDKDLGYKAALSRLLTLVHNPVAAVVGIRSAKGGLKPIQIRRGKGYRSRLTLAEAATVNEFGSPAAHIPERPAFRTAFDANAAKYAKQLETAVKAAIDGKATLAHGVGRVALGAVGDIQRSLRSGRWAQNAPRTIRIKGSSRPLVDSGRTAQSVDMELYDPGTGR